MARMPSFEEIRGDFERGVQAAGQRIEQPFRRHYLSQSVQSQPSQPEVPVSSALLTDAEKAAHALAAHVATLLANPLVDAVIEAGLGTVLTSGEVSAVVAFVKAIEAERQPAADVPSAPAQPQASFTPAGNGTGAQPVQASPARTVVQ